MENTNSNCTIAGPGWQTALFIVNPSILKLDSWHHIVFTYSELAGTSYLDGNLVDSFELKGGQIQSCPGGDLRFGIQFKGGESYFKGAMDEIRIYNRQLNGEEVRALYGLKTK